MAKKEAFKGVVFHFMLEDMESGAVGMLPTFLSTCIEANPSDKFRAAFAIPLGAAAATVANFYQLLSIICNA